MKRKLLLFITTLTVGITMQSQTVSPVCPDFTDINAPYVKAFTGYTDDPFAVQGVVNGRHTIITTQGTDPHTGNGLSLLPPGEGRVIKLGNEQIGAEAEALTYRFIVDKDNPVLLVKFAVVLEDPGHDMIAQPRFVIRITDKDGNLIEDCAEYDVSAGGDIPGFQSYQSSFYTPVRWRDWTNIGLDVSRFAGQEVQVQFITYDCSASAHFGYAYFTASCMSNRLQLDGCSGSSQFTLEAPDNFESYLWSNGATTRTTTFNTAASNDSQISCTVTSATGCQFPLYAFVTTNSGGIGGSFQDIICEGEAYTKHHFNLPPQEAGKHFYQNTIVNPQTCDDDEVIELELTVIKRYNLIKAAICYGEDYTVNGFDITLPAVGIRRDTLHTGIIHGCDTYNVLELTVSASFNMPDVIQGDASPCSEELITYSFAGAESFASFEWTIPANAVFYKSNEYMQQIQLYYTDDTPGVLSLGGKNGCGSSTTSLPITPRPTHHIRFNEEICEGTDFNMHNFNLGVQDSVGYFVYEKHLESSLGCDSSVVLALNVLPMPEVRIEPDSAVLCNPGDEITLWALTDSMKYAEITEEAKLCGDYDIWYGKLTQSNPANFNIVNLLPTTCGIVYYYGSEKKIVIPNNISGRDVIGIGIGGSVAVGFGPVEEIILPSSVITINADAFSNNPALTSITIPESVVNIAPGIFDGCPNVTVRCYENSPIHQFAVNNSIKFELIEDCPEENAKNVTDIKIYDCDLNYLWNTGSTEGFITENPTETTEYSVTVTTQNGCSAEAKRTVIVNTNAPQTVHDTICEGDTYTKYGINATTSGVYPVTITKDDCSFTLNVNLKVNEKYEGKIVDVACAGEPYQRNGLDITLIDPGIFRDTLRFLRTTGCDSIVALEITVLPAAETFLRDTVCQNQPYNKNGFNLPAQYITGKFTHAITVPSSANCDSTIMLKLLVNPVFNHIISDEVEQNGTYNRYNFNFPKVTKDTTATVNLTSIAGCDSTVVLNLKVNCKNDTVFIADSIFVGQDYNKHGFTVPVQSAVTELSDTLRIPKFDTTCDSVLILNLKVKDLPLPPCENDTVFIADSIFAGQNYSKHGFTIPIQNAAMELSDTLRIPKLDTCDSILILNLKVKDLPLPPCENDTVFIADSIFVGQNYSKHRFTIPVQNAATELSDTLRIPKLDTCDSILILNLKVKDLPLPPCENDTVFIVDSIFAGQDYNQHGFTIPVQNAATVRSDTLFLKNQAACDSLVILKLRVKSKNGCPEIEIPIIFTPNSDRQNDKWEIHNINCYEHIVEIYDRFGKLLRRWKNNFTGWDGTYWGNPMPATDYWYIIYLEKNEESKSGHFTLLRR